MKVVPLLCICVITFLVGAGIGLYSSSVSPEEQVSIQEEEMEIIGTYNMGAFLCVWKIHDNKDNVTCWTTNTGGISCIPDHMLTP